MTPEVFVEWLRRRGHKVLRTNTTYWFNQGPRVFQAFPYHETIRPCENELQRLLLEERGIALRYSTDLECRSAAASYHVVLERNSFTLEMLSKNARYDVRKGLEHAEVSQIRFGELAEGGWHCRKETLERQGRINPNSLSEWTEMCRAAEGLEGFDAWAALHESEIVAACICFKCDDVYYILNQQSLIGHMKFGINNAIAFKIAEYALAKEGISSVFYGLHSLNAPPSVDQFKLRMGFEARPVRQRVLFNPKLAPFVNRASLQATRFLGKAFSDSILLSKAEGMMRLCLEGNKPLDRQEFPVNIADRKQEILASASLEAE